MLPEPHANATDYDAVLAGGGLIGLTLALALAQGGLKVCVVDAVAPETALGAPFDGRVSAIARSSCKLLEALGVWPYLKGDAQPIEDIMVTDGTVRGGAAPLFLHFDHRETGDEPLGHLIENRVIRTALHARMQGLENITFRAPERVVRTNTEGRIAEATLGDSTTIRARLIICAEGRGSPLRAAAGIRTISWSYKQSGIVTTVAHEKPHRGVAQEFFLPSGPFAILPMTGNRSSLVWTERTEISKAFMALSETAFEAEVAQRFGTHLGALSCAGPRWCYPLNLELALCYTAPRFVLVGDAAHGIHPIAGQGFNLGLRGVAALGEVIVDAARLGLDIGADDVLERYQRWRRFDTVLLAASTDALNRLFSNDFPPLRLARDLGLAAVGRMGPLRRYFMRQAMGETGDMPRLLRGEAI